MKIKLIIASLLLALAVIIGAFGAHALEAKLTSKLIQTFETGARYHFLHALGLLILPLMEKGFKISLKWSFLFGFMGILFFSFNCYLYALTQFRLFAMLVPIGGFCFIFMWLNLALNLRKGDYGSL